MTYTQKEYPTRATQIMELFAYCWFRSDKTWHDNACSVGVAHGNLVGKYEYNGTLQKTTLVVYHQERIVLQIVHSRYAKPRTKIFVKEYSDQLDEYILAMGNTVTELSEKEKEKEKLKVFEETRF